MKKKKNGDHDEDKNERSLRRIAEALEDFAECFCELVQRTFAATDFQLVQIQGESPMSINGVQAGGSGVFQASLIPGNAAPLQSGPTFSTPDALVTLTQDPANPFNVTAAVDATDAQASFALTVTGVNSVGATITHTFTIPIVAAPPPVALDFDLNQLS